MFIVKCILDPRLFEGFTNQGIEVVNFDGQVALLKAAGIVLRGEINMEYILRLQTVVGERVQRKCKE